MDADFVGKAALKEIAANGIERKQVGLLISGEPITGSNNEFWPIMHGTQQVGVVTSAVYSPRLDANIALAMVSVEYSELGTETEIVTPIEPRNGTVVEKPFYDPKKSLAGLKSA
jgi:aminomethyltransferase